MSFEVTTNNKQISFLLVEDNEDHAHLVMRGLKNNWPANDICHVKDGEEALNYLFARGVYQQRVLPDVILLDINLPKISGHEVLSEIKKDSQLYVIPVIILTTSASETDCIQAYKNHANSYIVKPLDYKRFFNMIESLKLYWGVWNQAP